MSATAIPGDLDTARGPPLRVPLLHFLVAVGLLLAGAGLWLASALGVAPALAGVARAHLLLTGWVCVTIAGAMTQFVPVWSGVALHSRRLARAQLWLLTAGLTGFVACLLAGRLDLLWLAGVAVLAGFWTFAYNLARTLASARPWDHTERHFALALGFLVLATLAGTALATGFVRPVAAELGLGRGALRAAHLTLAVLGIVLTTVFGALAQLAPMFTNVEADATDRRLLAAETALFPGGVLVLAAGRLLAVPAVAVVGVGAVGLGTAAFAVALGRTLARARAARTPTLTRYAGVAMALPAWLALAVPTWLANPLRHPLGGPVAAPVLVLGVCTLVVAGTLYHVVPFLVWVERYSDRLGLATVPSVDELYDGRLAAADFGALVAATVLLTAAAAGDVWGLPTDDIVAALGLAGTAALVAGAALFAANLGRVVRRHVHGGLRGLLAGTPPDASEDGPADAAADSFDAPLESSD
ncbi:hypothetical protein [Haloglomus litoreum]|uniref:hypothetical protein n=1 Tax=Haloglomus litoreum TaxID=3034026 RepID=UPI0023E8E454|nr:hypothetical protein [Haloglomus sp. DT116]